MNRNTVNDNHSLTKKNMFHCKLGSNLVYFGTYPQIKSRTISLDKFSKCQVGNVFVLCLLGIST